MSCAIETIISCDICAENNGGDDRYKTAKVIRASRGKEGWTYRDGKDYCPKCSPAQRKSATAPKL